MSEAQERRKQESWDTHWAPIFDKSFQELRDFKAEIDLHPVDSEEYASKMKIYNDRVEALRDEYDKLHP
jgi:uncharacterized coiled-coil DUF342 family protein